MDETENINENNENNENNEIDNDHEDNRIEGEHDSSPVTCSENQGGCDHKCNVIDNRIQCECFAGFKLDEIDGRTCHGKFFQFIEPQVNIFPVTVFFFSFLKLFY